MGNTECLAAEILLRQMEKTDKAFEALMQGTEEENRPAYVKEYYVPAMVPLAEAIKKLMELK